MMKKAFVWDPVMRSSDKKYDPCILKQKPLCKDCKITLIADRFLGKEFQKILGEMGKGRGKYPYVIIADTLGCNLRCWFCYAYKFFDKQSAEENNCSVAYVTPKRLAKQFGCKLEKLSDFNGLIKAVHNKDISEKTKEKAIKHLQMKLPLMRIRISGGEPIFSTKNTITNPTDSNTIKATINYWLVFFEELDKIVGKIKSDGKLNIIDKTEVKNKNWKDDLPFPTCLAERSGRLNIRFDTNGILFGDKEITETFIGGLFKLHEENKLNHLFIEIDYSFKGATPVEYGWSQRKDLPVNPSKIDFDYELESHPQLPGYFNLVEAIDKYSNNKGFCDWVGITVERGINHNFSFKTYLNCKESLDWDKFSKKTGIKFSVVDNPIEMFNWRNFRPKSCFIHNGADIKIAAGEEVFDLKDNPNIGEFDEFRREHYPDCYFVIHPVKKKITLKKTVKKRWTKLHPSQKTLTEIEPAGWLFSGSRQNWKIAIQNKKWGVKTKHRRLWEKIKPNDYVLFYVTRPISKIIGFAQVKNINEEKSLLWPDEIKEKNVKYPLRINFEKSVFIPREDWNKGIKPYGLDISHGINPICEKKKLEKVVKKFGIQLKNRDA